MDTNTTTKQQGENTELMKAPPVLEVDRGAASRKVLPDSIYAARTRAVKTSEITESMIHTFLEELEKTGLWETSARRAGLNARHIRKLKKLDDDFKAMCDDAMETYVDTIEAEAHRRGVEGWDEPVFSHKSGAMLGTIRKFDSNLLQMILKRHRKEFGDKAPAEEGRGMGGVIVVPVAIVSPGDWAKQFNQPTTGSDGIPSQLVVDASAPGTTSVPLMIDGTLVQDVPSDQNPT